MKYVLRALSLLLVLFVIARPVSAQSMYGTLSNFDVFNDTGQECHGFEIELDGLSSKDVVYEFSSPNSQYPAPKLTDFPGGVFVDYESPYNASTKKFTITTPVPASITPTLGHQCWYGAVVPGGNKYPNVGCEHFGLSLTGNPTAVHYRWLVADPANAGNLKKWGTDVVMPAPVWTVTPAPPIPNPPPPVIHAVAPPPPENPEAPEPQFGDAVWIKTFVIQKSNHAVLNNMVQDGSDDAPDSDVEVEMALSQAGPAGLEKEVEEDKPLDLANNAVIRRYEIYKYLGDYDPESHEALCDSPDGSGCSIANPVGPYIGSQIAAVNLVPGTPVAAQITTSGFVYSRVTKTFIARVTIKNTGAQDATAPLSLVFRKLPFGVTLVNPSGSVGVDPYFTFSSANKLAAGASVSFYVQFNAATGVSFTPAVFSGKLQ